MQPGYWLLPGYWAKSGNLKKSTSVGVGVVIALTVVADDYFALICCTCLMISILSEFGSYECFWGVYMECLFSFINAKYTCFTHVMVGLVICSS